MDNLHWWYKNGVFESSAEAKGQKMGIEDEYKNMIAHFIDCNCLETCRVGGGPAEDGCESPVLPCIHYISCSTNESFFGFLVGSVQWVGTILQWVWTILQLNFRLVIGIAGLNLQPYIYL